MKTLEELALEINSHLIAAGLAAPACNVVDITGDATLAAAAGFLEARQQIPTRRGRRDGSGWTAWCKANFTLRFRYIEFLVSIARAPNPRFALMQHRNKKALAEAERRARAREERKVMLHVEHHVSKPAEKPKAEVVVLYPPKHGTETEGQTCQLLDFNREMKHGRKLTTVINHYEKLSPTERTKFAVWLWRNGGLVDFEPREELRKGSI